MSTPATRARSAVGLRDQGSAPAEAQPTIGQRIMQMQEQFQLAMPRGAEAAQLVRDALTAIRATPKLEECEWHTVIGGLMTCAQLGLRPGVLGHAWLLPFWSGKNRRFEAQLVIGYQGLVELVHRSDRVISIAARTVFTNDEFALAYGAESDIFRHVPAEGRRGEPVKYYAIARMKGGGYALTDPMSAEDMAEYRDRYAMAKTKEGKVIGPWADQFEGMAHKTMIRRLAKLLPKSTDLARALEVDGSIRMDLTPDGIDRLDYPDAIEAEPADDSTGGLAVQTESTAQSEEWPPPPPVDDILPAVVVPPAPPAEPAITSGQRTALFAGLNGKGVRDKDDQHRVMAQLVHRPIASANDLTRDEAGQVLDTVDSMTADDLRQLLTDTAAAQS